jgi:predicted permease
MKTLDNLFDWLIDTLWDWVWGHVYQIFIPILIASVIGIIAQIMNQMGFINSSPNDIEWVKEQTTQAYNIVNALGILSDVTAFISLVMLGARVFRDISKGKSPF